MDAPNGDTIMVSLRSPGGLISECASMSLDCVGSGNITLFLTFDTALPDGARIVAGLAL